MYAWIWRRLPFGLPGRIIGSLVLLAMVGAMLWFWAFPTAEPLLPFDDVNVTDQNGPGGSGGRPRGVDPSESIPPDDVIPYSTEENQQPPPPSVAPSPSPKRR